MTAPRGRRLWVTAPEQDTNTSLGVFCCPLFREATQKTQGSTLLHMEKIQRIQSMPSLIVLPATFLYDFTPKSRPFVKTPVSVKRPSRQGKPGSRGSGKLDP